MTPVTETLLTNAALLTVFAVIAWLLGLGLKRPGLMHLIWLLVLLRALSPPLLDWPVLPSGLAPGQAAEASLSPRDPAPSIKSESATEASVVSLHPPPDSPQQRQLRSDRTWGLSSWNLLLLLWLAGSGAVLGLTLLRARRFEKLLDQAALSAQRTVRLAAAVAARLGTRSVALRMVGSGISPHLWYRPGRLLLVLPGTLLERLTTTETRLLLAHELAHFKRGDHWVRLVELAASVLFWWHPVLPWVRSKLRQQEEECCDLEVVAAFPDQRTTYARTLVKVAEYLSENGAREPRFSCGVGLGSLQERIERIMDRHGKGLLFSGWQKLAFLAACGWALLLFPTAAQGLEPVVTQEHAATSEALQRLRDESLSLEQQLEEIRAKQMDLEVERVRLNHRAEMLELQREIERLAAQGENREAEWLTRHSEILERRVQIRAEQMQLEKELQLGRSGLERRLRTLEIELADAHRQNDREGVNLLETEAWKLKSALASEQQQLAARQIKLRSAVLDLDAERAQLDVERMRMEGKGERAEGMEKEVQLLRARQELELRHEQTQQRLKELKTLTVELKQSLERAGKLRSLGRVEEADELEARILQIRRKLEEKP